MKKILFFSYPVESHVNPTLKICSKLEEKNIKIIYYTLSELSYKFKKMKNVEVREYPYKEVLKEYIDKAATMSNKFGYTQYMLFDCTRHLIEFTVQQVKEEKPALIINDVFAMWGKIAGKLLNIPIANFSCIFIMDPKINKICDDKQKLRELLPLFSDWPTMIKALRMKSKLDKKYNHLTDTPMNFLSDQGNYTIVTSTKLFHPNSTYFGDNVRYIGNDVSEYRNAGSRESIERDCIFVSIGTMFDNKAIWNKILTATKGMGYNIIMVAYGNNINYINKELLDDNVEVYQKLTLEEYKDMILRAKVFINHGGMNSVTMSIMCKTPMLICPNTFERHNTGKVVERCNCGRTFNNNKFSHNMLKEKIEEIILDTSISKSLDDVAETFYEASDCNDIVNEIMNKFIL